MRALLASLGDPQLAFPSSTSSGRTGSRPRRARSRRYCEPRASGGRLHVAARAGWHERLDRDPADASSGPSRGFAGPRKPLGATQFETLTAAALAEFAAGVDVAVVEAGLGGRLDATNVVDAPVVLLTNVAPRAHRGARRDAREDRAEKLAVAHAARVVVMSASTFEELVRRASWSSEGRRRPPRRFSSGRWKRRS